MQMSRTTTHTHSRKTWCSLCAIVHLLQEHRAESHLWRLLEKAFTQSTFSHF